MLRVRKVATLQQPDAEGRDIVVSFFDLDQGAIRSRETVVIPTSDVNVPQVRVTGLANELNTILVGQDVPDLPFFAGWVTALAMNLLPLGTFTLDRLSWPRVLAEEGR